VSVVVFYEKPGCVTNARQRALLERHGCSLQVRNLLTEPWTEARLYEFLRGLPVADWFNPAAPAIRSGRVDPQAEDQHSALALLRADPLLIRRPLLDTRFGKTAGFADTELLRALGIPRAEPGAGYRDCARPTAATGCAPPG
jgi:nitrogenase-associated protein